MRMSFQAYLDSIKAKTGLDPADFRRRAAEKGLIVPGATASQVIEWLGADYGLGRGHAMAIFATMKPVRAGDVGPAEVIADHFTGTKAHWRPVFDDLIASAEQWGPVALAPTRTYISLLKGRAKFAIIAVTGDRLSIGIKLKTFEPTERFAASGTWNSMVTHRVTITDAAQVDAELLNWLHRAWLAV